MTNLKTIASMMLCLTSTPSAGFSPSGERAIVHDVAFDGCHFKIPDLYRARVSTDTESANHSASYIAEINPTARHPFETWIQFTCQNPVTDKTLSELAGIKLTNKGWVLDSSPDSIGPPETHTTFYPLHGKSWDAGGVTQDDINGDEERRIRAFAFCIPHDKLALCGVVRHVAYLSHLNESVLPQVIKLLESIEFIDAP